MEFFIILYALLSVSARNPAVMQYYGLANAGTVTYVLLGVSGGLFLLIYALRAAGLSAMAKNAGKKDLAWCAFIPFASTYLMGELAGEARLGSLRIKKIGVVVLIAELLYTAAMALTCVPQLIAFGDYDRYITTVEGDYGVSLGFSAEFSNTLYKMYMVGNVLSIVFQLIYILAAVLLFVCFFRRYAPVSYIWLTVLCVLLPADAFLIFAFRNRKRVDYGAYMRARAEEIRRRQQQYYNPYDPYNNPYNNPYNARYHDPHSDNGQGGAYRNGGQNGAPPREPEDPFGGFGSGGTDDPFDDGKGNGGGN